MAASAVLPATGLLLVLDQELQRRSRDAAGVEVPAVWGDADGLDAVLGDAGPALDGAADGGSSSGTAETGWWWRLTSRGQHAGMARGPGAVDWESLADLVLPELRAGKPGDLIREQSLERLEFDGLDLTGVDTTGSVLTECMLRSCVLDDAVLHRTRLTACTLKEVRATALDARRSRWRDVVVGGSRLGALVAYGSDLTRVTLTGSRIDFANLRGATVTQLQLVGCHLGELDLGQATLTQVRFADSRVDRLVVTGGVLQDVDLRGARLAEVEGVESLAGAVIDDEQLVQLAPAFAAHLGIRIASG